MSYSISATGTAGDVGELLAGQADQAVAAQAEDTQPAVRDHLTAAGDAVARLLEDVGSSDEDEVTVTVYGHANPGHTSREGYASETCTVQVTVTKHAEG